MEKLNPDLFFIESEPRFRILLDENGFRVINDSNKHKEIYFEYSYVQSLKVKSSGIDWVTTLLSFIVEFFFIESSLGNLKKNKSKIQFKYKNEAKEISLGNCDNSVIERLNSRLQYKLKKNTRKF